MCAILENFAPLLLCSFMYKKARFNVIFVNHWAHWFGLKNLSRTPSAWFSWGSKPDFRSCRMTVSYPSEMFFSFREKCCYMLIFANEYAVLIESFDNRFEATPFYHILYRWRKFFCFVYMYFVRLASSWWVVARGLSKLVKII